MKRILLVLLLVLEFVPALAWADDRTCPKPEQPVLSQTLSRWVKEGWHDDVLRCAREIAAGFNIDELSDDVRYQLAHSASESVSELFEYSGPLGNDAAVAADAWESYLRRVQEPRDIRRIRFGITKLMQFARYHRFGERLSFIATAVGKAGTMVEVSHANLLFSTLKRCPAWTELSKRLGCTPACIKHAESTLAQLRAELGELPWTGSAGLMQLSANASAINDEREACAVPQ